MKRFGLFVLGVLSFAAIAGCSKSPVISIPPPPPARLFVADTFKGVQVFTAPFSAASVPAGVLGTSARGVAVDAAGNIYGAEFGPKVDVFPAHATPGTAPSFTITIAGAGNLAGANFDGAGNLWVTDESGPVYEFTPPITASSVPAKTVTVAGASFVGVVFDRAGHMILASFNTASVDVLSPPFANGINTPSGIMTMPNCPPPLPAGAAVGGVGIDLKDHLIVGLQQGCLAIINPPFATGVTPSAFIGQPTINALPATEPLNSAFDSSGNLWVAYGGVNPVGQTGIVVFAPPFGAGSVPIFSFGGAAMFSQAFQPAFGP